MFHVLIHIEGGAQEAAELEECVVALVGQFAHQLQVLPDSLFENDVRPVRTHEQTERQSQFVFDQSFTKSNDRVRKK